MAFPVELEETLAGKFASVLPHLDERQRRLLLGAEARALGHGGIKLVGRLGEFGDGLQGRGGSGGGRPATGPGSPSRWWA